MKKIVTKAVVLSLILAPIAVLAGCQKKCGHHEPEMRHKVEKAKHEYGGK